MNAASRSISGTSNRQSYIKTKSYIDKLGNVIKAILKVCRKACHARWNIYPHLYGETGEGKKVTVRNINYPTFVFDFQ